MAKKMPKRQAVREGPVLPDIKANYKSPVIKILWCRHITRQTKEWNTELGNKLTYATYGNVAYEKVAFLITGVNTVILRNSIGKT